MVFYHLVRFCQKLIIKKIGFIGSSGPHREAVLKAAFKEMEGIGNELRDVAKQ
jgi:hypothetical protein